MSRRDVSISLGDMREHAREAIEMLGRHSLAQLESNRMMQLALTRLIEIVGEAANRIPDEMQEMYQEIPWRQIIGMRNRLIHGYDVIDISLLFNTIKYDIPPLLEKIEKQMTKHNLV